MDAYDRSAAHDAGGRSAPDRLAWLTPPPPGVGMIVRDVDGARLGCVCGIVVGESGAVIGVDVTCADSRIGRRRLPACAVRTYGEGVVCLYFRRDLQTLPLA